MGDPKRIRKKYKTPRQPFEKTRITHDLQLVGKYGLRNMKAVWKHQTMLGNFRGNARRLLSLDEEDRKVGERELLGRLNRLGLIKANATLDNVLSLKIEDFLERRLQTMVYKSGMATTPHHARQMIVHGHIGIGEKIARSPSYLVKAADEKILTFLGNSPFKKTSHKALPANVYKAKKPKEDKRRDDRGGRRPQRRPGQRSGPPKPAPTPAAEGKKLEKAVERPVPTKEGTVPTEKVILDEKVVDILPPKEKAEPKKAEPAKKVEPKKAPTAKKTELDKEVEKLSDLIEKSPPKEKAAAKKAPAKKITTTKKEPAKKTTTKKIEPAKPATKKTTKKAETKEEARDYLVNNTQEYSEEMLGSTCYISEGVLQTNNGIPYNRH